jgi:hypothetical protein
MISSDFKCEDCKKIFIINKKKIVDDFDTSKGCPFCCSKNIYRIYSNTAFFICSGMVGNAANGYSKNISYHPTSLGKFKGKKIK